MTRYLYRSHAELQILIANLHQFLNQIIFIKLSFAQQFVEKLFQLGHVIFFLSVFHLSQNLATFNFRTLNHLVGILTVLIERNHLP